MEDKTLGTAGSLHLLPAQLDNPFLVINRAVHSAYPRSAGWGKKFEQITAENLNYDLGMQLGGAILFSQRILSCFTESGGGSLVHLSSI